MKPSTWAAVAGGAIVELLGSLVERLRDEGSGLAVEGAADVIARAVMRVPLQIRQHAHAAIATAIVDVVAKMMRLNPITTLSLSEAVGQRLVLATGKELASAADDILEATKRWEKALK